MKIDTHIDNITSTASQKFYILKILKNHGMNKFSSYQIFQSLTLSRLTYASPAWWGFCSAEQKKRLQAILNRAIKWGHYPADGPTFDDICEKRSNSLFNKILSAPSHVLHPLLPPVKITPYNLRKQTSIQYFFVVYFLEKLKNSVHEADLRLMKRVLAARNANAISMMLF